MFIALALALISAMVACAQTAPPGPSGAATIPDVSAFLAQSRCADGALEVVQLRCAGAQPQRARDPMLMRRRDWPAPDGFQVTDALVADDGRSFVTLFSFPPFGPFDARKGDGGEVYVVDGPSVRIAATEDGGQMRVVQGFYGAACGGTGWILFRNDATSGRWATTVARLRGEPIPSPCQANRFALTRYRLEAVSLPFIIGGRRVDRTLPTVISEHFNAATLARASAMERSLMAKGVGRVVWEAWSRRPPTATDLAARCPGTVWSVAPEPGWYLDDCRYATNITGTDGSMTGDRYAWPPAGTPLP